MKLREQSTLGWLLLPILATQVLGHHAKQNPELLREPDFMTVRTPRGDVQVRADQMVKMGRRRGMGAVELSELYPEPRRNSSPVLREESGSFTPELLDFLASAGSDIRTFKAGDMRYWSTTTGKELTKEQVDGLPCDGTAGYVVGVKNDDGSITVSG